MMLELTFKENIKVHAGSGAAQEADNLKHTLLTMPCITAVLLVPDRYDSTRSFAPNNISELQAIC